MHAKINFNILKLLITIIKIYKFFPAQIDFLIFLNQTIKNPNKFFFIPFDKVFFLPFYKVVLLFLECKLNTIQGRKTILSKKYKICIKVLFLLSFYAETRLVDKYKNRVCRIFYA